MFATAAKERVYNNILLCENDFDTQIRQVLSDELRSREVKARDAPFSLLGVHKLVFKVCRSFGTPKDLQSRKMLRGKDKLCSTVTAEELVFTRWRVAIVAKICRSDLAHFSTSLFTIALTISKESLACFLVRCLFPS